MVALPRKPRKTTVRFAGRPSGLTVAIWKYLAYGMCFCGIRSNIPTEPPTLFTFLILASYLRCT